MTYFLYRLLALSILSALLSVAIGATGSTEAVHVDMTLLLISASLAGIGLVLAMGRDMLGARAKGRPRPSLTSRRLKR